MSSDQRFFDYLKRRIGLDVASVGPAIIERAVRQRCTALKVADNDLYWQHLISSEDEQQALIESVIVPETWFFRYPESFATLGRLATKRLAEIGSRRTLRILSLPCSTGEEPYSIVMALLDAGLSAHQFSVQALDVSPYSVQKAQRAQYGKNSFRGQLTDFRERYFSADEDGYRLSGRVCDQVTFNVGNLLDPAILGSHLPYDFVFCRNLLIYFDLKTQQQALDVLKLLTREDGVLFIGPAEGSLLGRLGMRSIGAPQSFAFSHNREPEPAPPVAKLAVRTVPPLAAVAPRAFVSRVQAPVQQAPQAKAEGLNSQLQHIATLANEGKSTEARVACEQLLKHHGPHAQAFYWLGLLSDVEGQAAQAQTFYRKALYLQPQHSEALVHLAALLESLGDAAGAKRLQERAVRLGRSDQSEGKQ